MGAALAQPCGACGMGGPSLTGRRLAAFRGSNRRRLEVSSGATGLSPSWRTFQKYLLFSLLRNYTLFPIPMPLVAFNRLSVTHGQSTVAGQWP